MSKVITVGGAATVATALFVDPQGVAQPLASKPVWAATPDGLVALTPADDGMTCSVAPVAAGDVTLTATAEGDPTPGKNTIVATAALTVAPDEDVSGTITFS
jgi:hypothetical protein